MLLRELRAEFDHFLGVIDGDDFFSRSREELGEGSLSGAEVGDHHRRQEPQQGVGQRLPRTTGHISAAEFSRKAVEILGRLVLAFSQRKGQVSLVLRRLFQFLPRRLQNRSRRRPQILRRRVENVFSNPAVAHQILAFELCELGRDSRLRQAEDFLQFGDHEFLLDQQQHQPQPHLIGQHAQRFQD